MSKYKFGNKIRLVRERKNLTLKFVANNAGVSDSLLSQIERNKVSPSIDTLLQIAKVLDIDFEYLFSEFKKNKKINITRKDQGRTLSFNGISYKALADNYDFTKDNKIETFLMEIEPGKTKGDEEYGHQGTELGLILEGKGLFKYGTEEYELESGDSVSFSSSIPHKLINNDSKILKAVWIVSPPRLFNK